MLKSFRLFYEKNGSNANKKETTQNIRLYRGSDQHKGAKWKKFTYHTFKASLVQSVGEKKDSRWD